MTDKEKAKAYDEAVKKAQCWLNDPQTIQDCNYTIEDAIQNIFPVLAKNEDEMIRKELINWINGKTTYEWSYEWCENKDRWIAYLEKLKENPKSAEFTHHETNESLEDAVTHQMEDDGDVDDFVRKGIDDIALKYAELGAKWQKEQKSAEWSEEDEEMLSSAIEYVQTYPAHRQSVVTWLKSLRLQPKEEWSKEDEEIFNNIIEKAKGGHWIQMDEIVWLIARFKSLRPQPRQEWSEEDEKIYQTVFNHFNSYEKYSCSTGVKKEHILSWLKSLKPSWKPSEEQMEALKNSAYGTYQNGDGPVLRGLYEQLLKLGVK